ncbi:MAG: SgcJ/EcaC family oxidoreductase [Alphaproteobacteria bacterium]|nr:MAG: SgcJ/EcaC family oxidoreductase [Alphaproteobacteria bacterium]
MAHQQNPDIEPGDGGPTPGDVLQAWLGAVGSGDPKAVLSLYAPDAILLPTLSSAVLDTPSKLYEYFRRFTAIPGLKGALRQRHIRLFGDTATASGIYAFTFRGAAGARRRMAARFSFVFRLTDKSWRIIEHHSSVMPEQPAMPVFPANNASVKPRRAAAPLRRKARAEKS